MDYSKVSSESLIFLSRSVNRYFYVLEESLGTKIEVKHSCPSGLYTQRLYEPDVPYSAGTFAWSGGSCSSHGFVSSGRTMDQETFNNVYFQVVRNLIHDSSLFLFKLVT